MLRGHGERVAPLDQPAAAAALAVVGDAGQRLEVRRVRAPVEPVGQHEREHQAGRRQRHQPSHAAPEPLVLPQSPDPESLDRQEHHAGAGAEPGGARARRAPARPRRAPSPRCRCANPARERDASDTYSSSGRPMATRWAMKLRLPKVPPGARAQARQVGLDQTVGLHQPGDRAEDDRGREREQHACPPGRRAPPSGRTRRAPPPRASRRGRGTPASGWSRAGSRPARRAGTRAAARPRRTR